MKDKVREVLSEVRTLTLSAQILLGFQYHALFQSGFEKLPSWAKSLEAVAFALMLAVIACLIAPSPFHRLSEGGEATVRLHGYAKWMIEVALLLFATAIGINVALVSNVHLGAAGAILLGAVISAIALWFWFGVTLMHKTRPDRGSSEKEDERVSLKEKINELLTEARIVLPGAQALLGFQLSAYLTESFAALPPTSKAVHTASLLLIALAMILLMSPAPYHRIAEGGEDTARFDKVAVRYILVAMVPLGLGLAGDFYVVLAKVLHSPALAAAGAGCAMLVMLSLWFAVPLSMRRARAEIA